MYNSTIHEKALKTQDEILHELQNAMAANDLACDDPIVIDGQIHRYSIDHKRRKPDEWYICFEGISLRGNYYLICKYGSWSTGEEYTYKSWNQNRNDLDAEERKELHAALKKRREEAKLRLQEIHDIAAENAKKIWENSSKIPTLNSDKYPKLKQIIACNARYGKNPQGHPAIILPLYNIENDLRSLQFISVGDGGKVYKSFLADGEKRGHFMVLGNLESTSSILVSESYSTSCTCYQAVNIPTVVSFDCGNLKPVIATLREKYLNTTIIICSDDDRLQKGNPGRTAAFDAANEFSCKIALPVFPDGKNGTDFNDLMLATSLEEVTRQIQNSKNPIEILVEEATRSPSEKGMREKIYHLAYLATQKQDHVAKDMILNQLYVAIKCHGITKRTIQKEFKVFLEENQKHNNRLQRNVPADERLVINELEEEFGSPISFNSKGDPAGINQMFFAGKFQTEKIIIYEPFERAFYDYCHETGLWKYKTEDAIKIELGTSFHSLVNLLDYPECLNYRSECVLSQLSRLLKGMIEKPGAFQKKRGIIHVANGVIHIKEDPDELHKFDPQYLSRNRSEIKFNPNEQCPRFLNELLIPAINPDDIELLQKYAGQCLLGHNPSQTILLLIGSAGGGKSTLVSVLEKIVSLFNVAQLRLNHLTERFELASFQGKTLLTGKDVPTDFLNHKGASVLKALVGGDRLSVEEKNANRRFEIFGEFNVIITANGRLHVHLDSDIGAWKRRLLLIEFEQPAPEKPIANFDDLLVQTEGPGILNWMIEGAIKLLYELEKYGKIQTTKEQADRRDNLLAESDSIRAFVTQCVTVDENEDVTTAELSEAYTIFCENKDWRAETVTKFENKLRNIMLEIHHATKRHDIKRNGKSLKGYSNVAIQHHLMEGESHE